MFDLPAVEWSTHARISGGDLWLGEIVATFGLLTVILGVVRSGRARRRAVRRRRLHRRRLLVHVLDQLRQPGGHHRPHADRHVRRHPPGLASRASSSPSCVGGRAGRRPRPLPSPGPPRTSGAGRRPPRPVLKKERPMADRPTVLFLCVHNAGRSQMALGWFNHLAGDRALALSGGSEPGPTVNPVGGRGHGRGRHRHRRGVPQAVDRRGGPGRRRGRHHGLRRRLPVLSRASATRTGSSTTRTARASTPCARSGTRSSAASAALLAELGVSTRQ